jgi:O-antigen ligase
VGSFRAPYGTVRLQEHAWAAMRWLMFGLLAALLGVLAARGDKLSLLLAATVVGTAALAVFAQLGFRSLLWWLVLSPIAYPFLRFPRGDALITFDRVWIAGMTVVILLTPVRGRRAPESRLLLLAIVCLSITFPIRGLLTPGSAAFMLRLWIDSLLLPLILLIASSRLVVTTERVTRLAGAFVLGGAILAVLGIAEKVAHFDLAHRSGGAAIGIATSPDVSAGLFRITGPYPWAETYGLSLVICLGATLYWIQARGRTTWFIGALVAALELVAIGFAFFRAIWIAAVIVLITAFGLRPKRFPRLVAVALTVGVLLLAISAPLKQNAQVSQRFSNKSNITNRLATYATGLEVFGSAPLFGVGFDRFAAGQAAVHPVTVGGQPPNPYPHSSFIWLLAEQGLFGALPLIIATFAGFRLIRAYGRRLRAREDVLLHAAVAGTALAYLVVSLTLTMLPEGPSNAFFAILLGAAIGRLDAIENDTTMGAGQAAAANAMPARRRNRARPFS